MQKAPTRGFVLSEKQGCGEVETETCGFSSVPRRTIWRKRRLAGAVLTGVERLMHDSCPFAGRLLRFSLEACPGFLGRWRFVLTGGRDEVSGSRDGGYGGYVSVCPGAMVEAVRANVPSEWWRALAGVWRRQQEELWGGVAEKFPPLRPLLFAAAAAYWLSLRPLVLAVAATAAAACCCYGGGGSRSCSSCCVRSCMGGQPPVFFFPPP